MEIDIQASSGLLKIRVAKRHNITHSHLLSDLCHVEGGLKGVDRMKEEEKQLKEMVEWLIDKDTNLWDIQDAFNNKDDFALFKEIFGEVQAKFFKALLNKTIYALFTWHNEKDEESHQDIRNKVSKLDARLRNHRHDFSKTYTGKAEY